MSDGPDYSMFDVPADQVASPQAAQAPTTPDYSMFAVPAASVGLNWSGPDQFSLSDVQAAAKAAKLDPALFASVVYNGEKSGARSVSPRGALGGSQLMPATAQDLGVNPYDTMDNLKGGATYLAQMLARYNGDQTKAVAAYNAGPGAVDSAGGVPNFPETQQYVQRVLSNGAPAPVTTPTMADPAAPAAPVVAAAPPVAGQLSISWNPKLNSYTDPKTGQVYGFPDAQGYVTGPDNQQYKVIPDAPAAPGQIPIAVDQGGTTTETPQERDTALGIGFGQGLSDVGATAANADLYASQHIPAVQGINSAVGFNPAQAVADLKAQRVINEARYNGNTGYGVGRFLGESLPTIPLMAATDGLGGLITKGVTEAAPWMSGVTDFLGGEAPVLGGIPSHMAQGAVQGAVIGGATSGGNDRTFGSNVLTGAAGGALVNPVVNRLLGAPGALIAGQASPGVTDLADTAANKYGINLPVDQIKMGMGDRSAGIRYSNDLSRPSTGVPAQNAANLDKIMKGITGSYGDASGDISPEGLSAARAEVVKPMNDIAARTPVINATDVAGKLDQILAEARQVHGAGDVAPIKNTVANIKSLISPDGTLSGDAYQALTRNGGPLMTAISRADTPYASRIRDVLDDALQGSASPDDVAALQNARFQYKNLMTVAKLAPKADANGVVSPALLRGAIASNFKNQAFQGAGPLGELSSIYQTFMKEPANSQTTPRLMEVIKHSGAAGMLGAGAGLGLETLAHQPLSWLGAAGGSAGLAAGQLGSDVVRGALNRSAVMRNMFLHGLPVGQTGNRLINAAGSVSPFVAPAADTGLASIYPPAPANQNGNSFFPVAARK